MPEPLVVVAAREFKQKLLARESLQVQEMTKRWIDVEDVLEGNIFALIHTVDAKKERGDPITESSLFRLDRYRRLYRQTQDEVTKYAGYADGSISKFQESNGIAGLRESVQAIQLSYHPYSVGTAFDRLPVEAVKNIVGISGDGKPLGELLKRRLVVDENGVPLPGMWDKMTSELIRGTALGYNPKKVARNMMGGLAEGLNKALVIGRTEGLRPYRQMSLDQYKASGVVEGQKRLSAHDGRVCAACIAADGTIYLLIETIPDHPQGRCTSVPIVKGIPEPTWMSGEAWLKEQLESTQIRILGSGVHKAWKGNEFPFDALIHRTDDPTWGGSITPTPLKELVLQE